jgi:hypothetical protein
MIIAGINPMIGIRALLATAETVELKMIGLKSFIHAPTIYEGRLDASL